MNPKFVFGAFIALNLVWTGVWIWVLASSRQTIPAEEVKPKVAALRRRLFYAILIVLGLVFLVSMRWLPYRPVRAMTLGQPKVTVDVVAQQWSWTFSRNEVPAGVPVEFLVSSKDVNHGFGIYNSEGRLLTQVQAMPGYTNHLIYVFDQPGVYTVRCLEYCGLAHHAMIATLRVQ